MTARFPPFLPLLLRLFNYHGNRWCASSHTDAPSQNNGVQRICAPTCAQTEPTCVLCGRTPLTESHDPMSKHGSERRDRERGRVKVSERKARGVGEVVGWYDGDVDGECDNGAELDGAYTHPNTVQPACARPSAELLLVRWATDKLRAAAFEISTIIRLQYNFCESTAHIQNKLFIINVIFNYLPV